MPRRRFLALVSVTLLMMVWGSTFIVTKTTVREIPPLTLGFLRFVIAAVFLGIVVALRRGRASFPRPLPLKQLVLMTITGSALFITAFNYAMILGSVSQGAIVFALAPAAVAVAAVIGLKERLSRRRIGGIALSIAGVILVVAAGRPSADAPHPLLGALLMMVVNIGWAVYTVIAKRLAQVDQIIVIAIVSAMAVVLLLPFAAIELAIGPRPTVSINGWLGLLFLGVVASSLAYVVYNRALRELDASVVGALVNLDPIVGVATAVVFLGEVLGGWQIVGGIAALIGMWLAAKQDEAGTAE
jgi:drug/metabolite transporter (DMT)-like permease